MYRNAYQRGMLTIFYSVGSKPLAIWDTKIKDGYIKRFLDQDIKSMVLEIGGTNVSTTYITCPKGNLVLGITMPFLVMIVKNLKKYFTFEVTILDETLTRRRFRVSNFQSTTQIMPLCTVMPIGLSDGWNQIQFNLAEFTRRAYKKQYIEIQKVKINANIRLRRIYFTEKLISEDQLPPEYKLYFPLSSKDKKKAEKENVPIKENIQSTSKHEVKADVDTENAIQATSRQVIQTDDVVVDSLIQATSQHEAKADDVVSKTSIEHIEEVSSVVSKKQSISSTLETHVEGEMLPGMTEEVTEAVQPAIQEKTFDIENNSEPVTDGAPTTVTSTQEINTVDSGSKRGLEDQ